MEYDPASPIGVLILLLGVASAAAVIVPLLAPHMLSRLLRRGTAKAGIPRYRIPAWAALAVLPAAFFLAAAIESTEAMVLTLHGKRAVGRVEKVTYNTIAEGGASNRRSRVTVLHLRFHDPMTSTDIRFEEDQKWSDGFIDDNAVPVLYDPENPQNARIALFAQLWAPSLFIFGFGILAGGFTYLAYRLEPRETRKPRRKRASS